MGILKEVVGTMVDIFIAGVEVRGGCMKMAINVVNGKVVYGVNNIGTDETLGEVLASAGLTMLEKGACLPAVFPPSVTEAYFDNADEILNEVAPNLGGKKVAGFLGRARQRSDLNSGHALAILREVDGDDKAILPANWRQRLDEGARIVFNPENPPWISIMSGQELADYGRKCEADGSIFDIVMLLTDL